MAFRSSSAFTQMELHIFYTGHLNCFSGCILFLAAPLLDTLNLFIRLALYLITLTNPNEAELRWHEDCKVATDSERFKMLLLLSR
jgi:hypothetical protein